jgi:hypothetical protein
LRQEESVFRSSKTVEEGCGVTSFDTKQIPSITPQQWQRLRDLLYLDQFRVLEIPWLRSATGMKLSAALALVRSLTSNGSTRMEWLVFHDCAEHSVAILATPPNVVPWLVDGSGPVICPPWTCPECEEVIENSADLRTEPRVVLLETVVFV